MNNIELLYRYPVKGLSAVALQDVCLKPGCGFPDDRKFAISDGSWTFDASTYEPRPKTDFMALLKYERLAELSSSYDAQRNALGLSQRGETPTMFMLEDPLEQERLADFLAVHLGREEVDPKPELVVGDGISFTNVSADSAAWMNTISLINLSSMDALGEVMHNVLDPVRFRANIYFRGATPWDEFSWVGKEIKIGSARAKVVLKTRRCAATNVNPKNGLRDLGIPQALLKTYRHCDLGVYAEIVGGATVSLGDEIVTF